MTRRIVSTVAGSALILGAGVVLILATGFGAVPEIAAEAAQVPPSDSSAPATQLLPPGDDGGSCDDLRGGENKLEGLRRGLVYKCCACIFVCEDSSKLVWPASDPRHFPGRSCSGASNCDDLNCPPTFTHPDKGICERSANSKHPKCRYAPFCLIDVPPE